MPDVFALNHIPALVRLREPELAIAVADDGDTDAAQAALVRLTTIKDRLDLDLSVVDALEGRLKIRRPLPPPAPIESLQSLVRRGRRRLERERQGGVRKLLEVRSSAIIRLRAIL